MEKVHKIKTWRIFDWLPDDTLWLEQQGIRFRVATNNIPIAQGNKVFYMAGDMGISVETVTQEQEMLLRLKFEPNIALLMEEIVLNGSHQSCVLSEIKF